MGNTVYVSLFNKICEGQRVCVRLGLSARVFGFLVGDEREMWGVCACVCVSVCETEQDSV